MDSSSDSARKMAGQEANYAEEAIEEMEQTGSTQKRCPRCGQPFVLEETKSGYVIRCETPNCFKLISRGL